MSNEPHDLTLQLLRETRAELVARFDGLDHRLHRIEQRLDAPASSPSTGGSQAGRDGRREEDRIIDPRDMT
jgi:hypothetical protein